MLDYRGYHAVVEVRPDDGLLFGRVLGVRDTVAFEAETAAPVRAAFGGAVDDSLAFCAEIEKDPDRPVRGGWNRCADGKAAAMSSAVGPTTTVTGPS